MTTQQLSRQSIRQQVPHYALNCFILLIPMFLWNILFIGSLPSAFSLENFWKDIPPVLGTTESVLRILVFALPVLMPLSIKTRGQKIGLGLYLGGLAVYFLSWTMQIVYPESSWSLSMLGFTACAFTPILWLTGIGLIGKKMYFKIPFHPIIYIALSVAFVVVHTMHAYIVYVHL